MSTLFCKGSDVFSIIASVEENVSDFSASGLSLNYFHNYAHDTLTTSSIAKTYSLGILHPKQKLIPISAETERERDLVETIMHTLAELNICCYEARMHVLDIVCRSYLTGWKVVQEIVCKREVCKHTIITAFSTIAATRTSENI